MYMWNTHLDGSIPSSIGQISNLQLLSLTHSCVSGTLPDSLVSLMHLHWLDLSSNCLSGTLPLSLAQLQGPVHWYYLYIRLDANRLEGESCYNVTINSPSFFSPTNLITTLHK
jgi:LRR receptor-like serine/threonine-protein kinase FLS2